MYLPSKHDSHSQQCAMLVTGGGRQPLSARFLRHFTQLCIPPPSDAATKTILTTILGGFWADWPQDLKTLCAPLVTCAIESYNRVCAELLPTPDKSHYTFNLRDLCKVAQVCALQCQMRLSDSCCIVAVLCTCGVFVLIYGCMFRVWSSCVNHSHAFLSTCLYCSAVSDA